MLGTTGQHSSLLPPLLDFFELRPDFELAVSNTDLSSFSGQLLSELGPVLAKLQPDLVLVQGDTTSAFIAALAAFQQKIPVAHVEAGLRTHQAYSPYPEELNRQMITRLATYHFAPTPEAKIQLLMERISPSAICMSGNTGIDALLKAVDLLQNVERAGIQKLIAQLGHTPGALQASILITIHRRENTGARLLKIIEAIETFARGGTHQLYFPVHPNPKVHDVVYRELEGIDNLHLLPPLPYDVFIWLLQQCAGILTDSGGIQEEACTLGIPTIVLRDFTERKEGLASQIIQLCDVERTAIIRALKAIPRQRFPRQTTFGDGNAAQRITDFLSVALFQS